MSNDTVLQVRMNAKVRSKAEKIFKRLGMSSSDAVRMFMAQTIEEEGLPFQPHIPNAESRKAIKEALNGGGEKITLADLRRQWDEA